MDSKMITAQEEELQFDCFDNETALEIGMRLVEKAKERNLPIAIDITRCRHQLFHASMPGSRRENDEWLRRKINVTYLTETSTLFQRLYREENREDFCTVYGVDPADHVASGGCFPVRIKGTGFIGTITVSGMADVDDHGLIVEVLREYNKRS